MTMAKLLWRRLGFAPVLFVLLLAINILLNPARFAPAAWGTLIGLAAPLIGAAWPRRRPSSPGAAASTSRSAR